jgi:epoxyqueuosine reductase
MAKSGEENLGAQIIQKAIELGACLAGIADVDALKESPSHVIYGKLDEFTGVGVQPGVGTGRGDIAWPENSRSAIIIAVEHPENRPDLDWWGANYRGGTKGNEILIGITARLSEWLEEEYSIKTQKVPYHVESGGIFLKDSAVMSGLGCIGKNNILVTPEFGPRVRLRAMLTEEALPGTHPVEFDPCHDCDMPCRRACPQQAFQDKVYSEEEYGLDRLPARSGVYSRHICDIQMQLDTRNRREEKIEGRDQPEMLIRFCRRCEFACPVGKTV